MISAADIRAALKRHYCQPAYGIVFEVAQSTGHGANRHLDAMAMSLWPSRGLTLYGIEIKVTVHDYRRELAQPFKAEELARFCDYFYIAAPAGIVPIATVPEKWGLLELRDDKIVENKPAGKHDAAPIGREFLAAIFRASSREVDPDTVDAIVRRKEAELGAKHAERVRAEVEHVTQHRNEEGQLWEKLCAEIGVEKGWYPDREMIAAVRAVHKAGVAKSYGGLRSVEKTLSEALAGVREAAAAMDLPVHDVAADLVRFTRKKKRV